MVGLVEKLFVAMVGMAALVSPGLSSAEDRRFTISFLGSRVMIKYESRWTGEGEGLDSYIAEAPSAKKIFVDFYEPEQGVAPEIKSVFVSGVETKRLFVIVAWNSNAPALDAGGSISQVFVYEESVD